MEKIYDIKEYLNMYKAVIFDMDGTILDTIEDLKDAINYTFKEFNHKCDFNRLDAKMMFGSGAHVAISRAMAMEQGFGYQDILKIGTDEVLVGYKEDTAEIERLKAVYKPYYKSHCDIKTGPYEGIEDLISKLRENNIATAVVSNKPDEAVQALCKRYFKGLFDFALGQRDEIRRKPERDMVDITLKKLGITKDEAIYVGDSDVDLYTAKNSGLDCISVDWGFRTKEYLLNSGADIVVSSCDEIFNIVVR